MQLEAYFQSFQQNIIGHDLTVNNQSLIYADWMASGRLYGPIEDFMYHKIAPIVANTFSKNTYTGKAINQAYQAAQELIKNQVNAKPNDHLICAGAGMSELFFQLQQILLKPTDQHGQLKEADKPVIFITHMEHACNHFSWLKHQVTLEIIPSNHLGLPDEQALQALLTRYKNRVLKIGSFTAANNVTGVKVDYYQLAEIMHNNGGLCFVDFAASAPYVKIDMQPSNPLQKLDVISFSPHKFLGGPGSCGVLVVSENVLKIEQVKQFEAGTPAYLQTIRAAQAMALKQEMGINNLERREQELVSLLLSKLKLIPQIHIIQAESHDRLAAISFYIESLAAEKAVGLLSCKHGIDTRAGSCFNDNGDINHYLLPNIINKNKQLVVAKRGWLRVSLHPTMSNADVVKIARAIQSIESDF
jgi:selenocysteine lyase/cysteine desulfurase